MLLEHATPFTDQAEQDSVGENLGEKTERERSKERWETRGLGEKPPSKSLVGLYPQDEAWWVWLLRQLSTGNSETLAHILCRETYEDAMKLIFSQNSKQGNEQSKTAYPPPQLRHGHTPLFL